MAAIMSLALVVGLGPAIARANSPSSDAAVNPIRGTESVSKNGAKLKWRAAPTDSVRPVSYEEGPALVPDRTIATAGTAPIGKSTPSVSPLSDPFGDAAKQVVPLPMMRSGQSAASARQGSSSAPVELLPDFPGQGAVPMRESARELVANPAPSGRTSGPALNLGNAPTGKPPIESGPKGLPNMDQELAAVRQDLKGRCPTPEDLKPIGKITHKIKPEEGEMPPECALQDTEFQPRSWAATTFTWKASCLCHKPAYFEQVQLERYGHSWGPFVQPFVSAAHFFVSVPFVPYKMGVTPPNECLYSLGYYRPGSCSPYMLDPLPLSVRGALFQGAAVTGFVSLLP